MAQLAWKRRLGRYKNRRKGVTEIVEKQIGLNSQVGALWFGLPLNQTSVDVFTIWLRN
jgi:hypothetical protein